MSLGLMRGCLPQIKTPRARPSLHEAQENGVILHQGHGIHVDVEKGFAPEKLLNNCWKSQETQIAYKEEFVQEDQDD